MVEILLPKLLLITLHILCLPWKLYIWNHLHATQVIQTTYFISVPAVILFDTINARYTFCFNRKRFIFEFANLAGASLTKLKKVL